MATPPSTEGLPGHELPADRDGAPSERRLWELIVAERTALVEARRAGGPSSPRALSHAAILRMLVEQARGAAGPAVGQASPLEVARALADVFRAEVDPSASRPRRLVARGLHPFNVEVLRPQAEFNVALVEVLRQVRGATVGGDERWVRLRLEGLASPTAWRVKSHRKDATGRLVELGKRSYLKALGPFVANVLEGQRQWNLAVIDCLEERVRAGGQTERARALLERVRHLHDPLALPAPKAASRATAFLWHQAMRRQVRFNAHVLSLLEGGEAAPTPAPDYAGWLRARQAQREQSLAAAARPGGLRFTVAVLAEGATAAALERSLSSAFAQRHADFDVLLVGAPAAGTAVPKHARLDPRPAAPSDLLRRAKAPWLVFLHAGDALDPLALAELAAGPAAQGPGLAYSDEDRAGAERHTPWFKPDFSYELLTACDAASRLCAVHRDALEALGGLEAASGAALYALTLKAAEQNLPIRHLAEVAVSRGLDARAGAPPLPPGARQALEAHLARVGARARVDERPGRLDVRYEVQGEPLVSIVVPFKDKPELLETLTRSLLGLTRYRNFELLLVSNDSREPATRALLASLKDPRVRTLEWNHPFHYPAINDFGASQAKGELLLFLNNDIEVKDGEWLHRLVAHAQRPGVGAVGPKLLFPDGRVQHAGVVVGMTGFAGHVFAGLPDDGRWTPFGTADLPRNALALTSAAVLLRRDVFERLGGFDQRFEVCGSDVDLCLKLHEQGLRVVYEPGASLVHHESASRAGAAIPTDDFWASFCSYAPYLEREPFYSPHLALTDTVPALRPEGAPPALDVALAQLAGREAIGGGVRLSGGRLAWVRWGQDMVRTLDASPEQLQGARTHARLAGPPRTLTWFLPYFDHAFGGVHTLFRFADLWRRERGVENRFVIYDYPHVTPREMEARVRVLFDPLPGALEVLKSTAELDGLPPADVSIATLWSSAYYVVRHRQARVRAYFVQDDESGFYPAGTLGGMAEHTYRLGLYGLFNSRGLHDEVRARHGMEGTFFEPSVDPELFHAKGRPPRQGPVRVLFYGRPSVDRNAFELGLEALRLLKQRLGGAVECLSAGEAWSPDWFGAEGVVRNLGVLPYRDTAALYRTVDVGLGFMFTRHPSYLPLEWMASGVAVVSNDNPANRWLFAPEENCLLAAPTASSVAAQLERLVRDEALRARIAAAGVRRLAATSWEAQALATFDALSRFCQQGGARRQTGT